MDQSDKVNYAKIYQNRFAVLRIAFQRFANYSQSKFEQFIIENENWLEDYSLYMALKIILKCSLGQNGRTMIFAYENHRQ